MYVVLSQQRTPWLDLAWELVGIGIAHRPVGDEAFWGLIYGWVRKGEHDRSDRKCKSCGFTFSILVCLFGCEKVTVEDKC